MAALADKSYQLGHFRDNDDSLRRLKKQAGIVLDSEFQCLKNAGMKSGQRILDMGCGPGIVSTEIVKRVGPSELIAADCNDISLQEAKAALNKSGQNNFDVKNINVYEVDAADVGLFDFVYSRLLFQHLSNPVKALQRLYSCLEFGGKLCVSDIDDRWLSVNPSVDALGSFIERVDNSQNHRGGDRHIGTKLSSYMQQAGFINIEGQTLLLTTDLIDKESFCDLIFGYKLEVVQDSELDVAKQEVEAIRKRIFEPNAWAGVAVSLSLVPRDRSYR